MGPSQAFICATWLSKTALTSPSYQAKPENLNSIKGKCQSGVNRSVNISDFRNRICTGPYQTFICATWLPKTALKPYYTPGHTGAPEITLI